MRIKTFPHRVDSLKAWRGVIYENTYEKDGTTYKHYRLVYRHGDGRKTLGFTSLTEVKRGIADLLKSLAKRDAGSIVLSGDDALRYQQAMELASDISEPLNMIVADAVKAKKVLGPKVSLRDASQYYAEHRGLNLQERSVSQVVAEMIRVKNAAVRQGDLSARYLKDLENRLGRFRKECNCQIANLKASRISAWLRGLGLSARSQNNFRTTIETMITFAKSCGYLTRHWDEMAAVPTVKEPAGKVEIFTADELSKLLSHANEKLLPFIALGAFAGLRSAELERITWPKVNLKTGYITIDASVAKTNSRRIVPIQPNLKAWLAAREKKAGRVCGYGNVTNELLKLARASGVQWKQNALRHSYASYRLAAAQDAAKVALEMGNSPKIVQQHYRQLVTPEDAATWFAIAPQTEPNVVQLKVG